MNCRFSVMTPGDIPMSSSSLRRASQVSWSFRAVVSNVCVEMTEPSRLPARTSAIKRFSLFSSLICEDLGEIKKCVIKRVILHDFRRTRYWKYQASTYSRSILIVFHSYPASRNPFYQMSFENWSQGSHTWPKVYPNPSIRLYSLVGMQAVCFLAAEWDPVGRIALRSLS